MPGVNKRSVLNVNSLEFSGDYAFINFLQGAYGSYPAQADFSQLDAQGWPTNNSVFSGGDFYWAFMMPSSANTQGPYVLSWIGEGVVWLGDIPWQVQPGSSGYTEIFTGRYSGINPRIIVKPDISFVGGLSSVKIKSVNNANPVRNVKFYFLADEADLVAGKVFRNGWKQTVITLNPGCIRIMNWTGGSSNPVVRWRDLVPPDYIVYTANFRTPAYPTSSGVNEISVGSAPGMPVTMKHGEVAQFCVGESMVGYNNAEKHITNITKAINGYVTCVGHGLTTGQKVMHLINHGEPGSMWQLHLKVATVTIDGPDHYFLNIDTRTFNTFVDFIENVGDYNFPTPSVTLEVGPGRGRYPIFEYGGDLPVNFWFSYWEKDGRALAVFDKYLVCDTDIGPGAWLAYRANVKPDGWPNYSSGVPFEICVALVNELNAMKTHGGPINLWVTMPYAGMMSVDPDYDALDNFPVNAVDRCLHGGGGWPGLTANAALLVEYSNETWNYPGGFFWAGSYLARIGQLRYAPTPGQFPNSGWGDYNTFPTVRAMQMHQELAAAYPTEIASGRLVRVMASQGGYPWGIGDGGPSDVRVYGNSFIQNDVWNIGNTAPYVKYEALAWAAYFYDSDPAWRDANWTAYTNAWLAAAGNPVAQETICRNWVVLGIRPSGEGTGRYGNVQMPSFNDKLFAVGRKSIMYEGGYDWLTTENPGNPTPDNYRFLAAVQCSAAWAAEQKAFFNLFTNSTNSFHPSIYIQNTNSRWGYNRNPTALPSNPYNYDSWAGGVEGAGLNLTWRAMGEYNNALDADPIPYRFSSFAM